MPLVVAQPAAPELDEHRVGLLAGGGAGVVHGDHSGVVPDLPAAPPRASAPVHLLHVHEVALVERTDVVPGASTDRHAGAERVVDGHRSSVARDPPVERGSRSIGRPGHEIEADLNEAREAEAGRLRAAVRVAQRRPDGGRARSFGQEAARRAGPSAGSTASGFNSNSTSPLAPVSAARLTPAAKPRLVEERARRTDGKCCGDGVGAAVGRGIVGDDQLDVGARTVRRAPRAAGRACCTRRSGPRRALRPRTVLSHSGRDHDRA